METHSHANIPIDIELIESQKENIQPIRSGRSAAQLVSLFNPSATTTAGSASLSCNPLSLIEVRKQSHLKFQHHIRLLEDALDSKPISGPHDKLLAEELMKDPLDIYLQYIRWTIEAYPAGGTSGESKLIPLLEQATRRFLKDERYQQDVRYLKCWIFYANQVNTTAIKTDQKSLASSVVPNNTPSKLVLNYVMHHRIGTTFSLLYLEYFKLFMPIERLESSEDDRFKLEQVLKFGISQTKEDDLNQQLVELLSQIQSISKNHSTIQGRREKEAKPKKKTAKPATKMINSKGKTKMKIFEDLEGHGTISQFDEPQGLEEGGVDSLVDPPFSLVSRWDNLGTVHSNRKQNTLNPSTWKGQKLPMKRPKPLAGSSTSSIIATTLDRPPAASTRSKIKVYEDHLSDDREEPTTEPDPTQEESDPSNTSNQQAQNETAFNPDILDNLLTAEIESQAHSIHKVSKNDEQSQVFNFDPLQFLPS
ncbi:hypothetical protein PCANC_27548 [Puccinia coronata f. sp. avenae]|uniref:BUB1 N-terminal domain-containing protein n=1 Tax=Puccinia coronata f. sp. avenae TaxID=200324 RepID=A0A2N5RWX8_9BASI|nr:hypothetical protein PCANC_27548 [Puccinia coronata f. sp. avenae]